MHAPTHLLFAAPMLVLAVLLTIPVRAQDSSPEAADAHFQAQAWQEAATAYEAVTSDDPSNRLAWSRLGWSLYRSGQYARALEVYRQIDEQGWGSPLIVYNLGVLYALAGDAQRAMSALERAVEAGYSGVQALQTDEDLASVRGTDRFEAIVARADRNARPCEFDERFRAFDFWVGEWNVYNPQDRLVGCNTITKEENGCVLVERWSGAGGSTGMSMNYYEPARDHWVQVWVSAAAYSIVIEGGFQDGAMRLVGTLVSQDGTSTPFRGTWTLLVDGRVRQFFEQSTDDGETWTAWFDGFYVRKEHDNH